MSFPQYLEYKDSGVAWLGEVPTHWQVHRLKNLFEIRKRIVGEDGHQVLSITQRGIRIRDIESNDGQLSMDYSKYQIVQPGDYAMNHMDLLTGFVDISPYAGVTSPDYRVFVAREGTQCDPRYLLSLLQNGFRQRVFYAYGQGASEIGRWRLSTDQFNDFRFPFPPVDEQAAIASFLDRETAKIDALITEQEKLIALLQEKRQAVISHAVTKGLNPNVPMKDSGVEWLGEVPGHWEVRSLKHLARLTTGMTPPTDDQENYEEVGYPWVRPEDLDESGAITKASRFLSEKGKALARQIPSGASLICCIGTIGKVGIVDESVSTNQQITAAKFHGSDRYFYFCTCAARTELENSATGNVLKILNAARLGEIKYPSPLLKEQIAVATFLDGETTKLDNLMAEARTAITLLQERRTALISAAVTGQIDVRRLAPLEVA